MDRSETRFKKYVEAYPLFYRSTDISPAYNYILLDNLWLFRSEFSCFLLLPQRISCDPKVEMIEPIGHSPAAADSNLVFRIRYGKHNNIIALITERALVPAVPYNSLSKLVYFLPPLCLKLLWFIIKFSCRQITASFFVNMPASWCFLPPMLFILAVRKGRKYTRCVSSKALVFPWLRAVDRMIYCIFSN